MKMGFLYKLAFRLAAQRKKNEFYFIGNECSIKYF